MTGTEVLQATLKQTSFVLNRLLEDLSDDDLLLRPVPSANHLAWQVGHLIVAERHLITDELPSAAYPELPSGFADNHSKEAAAKSGSEGFCNKSDYLSLFNEVRTVTIAEVGKLSDADLNRPATGRLAQMFPTLGEMVMLVSNHTLMHGGQVTIVRRLLGKPIVM